MSDFPQNITVTARNQMVSSSQGAPNSFLGNGSLYLDMTCGFITENADERSALNSHARPWIAHDWLATIGLGAFVAKRIAPASDAYIGQLQNTHYLANTGSAFELQTAQDELPDCQNQLIGEWIKTGKLGCGPSLSSLNINRVDAWRKDQYTSGRVSYERIMLGEMSEFSGSFDVSTQEFTAFVLWYRCQMLAGKNDFDASWLVHPEFELPWHGFWKEPWSATFSGSGRWNLTISLTLTENDDLDYLSTIEWYVAQTLAETTQASIDICTLTNGYLVPITQQELDATLVAKTAICTATSDAINTLS